MAWGEIKVEDQRKLFCEEVLSGRLSHAEACRQYMISRPTGYEWLRRYKEYGDKGLENRSSARVTQDHTTSRDIIKQILLIKHEFSDWGPKKIHAKLKERFPLISWPGTTTIGNILFNNGLVKSRKVRRRLPSKPSSQIQADSPNDIWCMDFKGWSLTKDGFKFDPFTLSDQFSRYLIRCCKLDLNDTKHVWSILELAFREYGLPNYLRSDNGPPFATCSPGRLSSLTIKLVKAGVMPDWIEPGKPQQNGRHERMHRTMQQEGFDKELVIEKQIIKLNEFQSYYNFERPHEALGQKTPGSIYIPSNRVWSGRLKEMEYSKEYKIGKVKSCGKMSFKGKEVYIGKVFTGELLGLKESESGFETYFGPIFLGIINDKHELEVKRRETRKKYKHLLSVDAK